MKKANHLVNETSPYLLQHAYNPVNWHAWNSESLQKAKDEQKPIILSIGYSSCHWCHVMEHESFEDEKIAQLMNNHFICIKVDREERPDIDQIYMDALHTLGVQGGWPLNVFLMPDKKPFYGGTYFPAAQWTQLLTKISEVFKQQPEELKESSDRISKVLEISELEKFGIGAGNKNITPGQLGKFYESISNKIDTRYGGQAKAPKFPMPNIWQFLIHYYHYSGDKKVLDQITLTLDQMANGGIYDQLEGGFSRYSVDEKWHAPHFEKMLYDNAQLISLYAQAYQVTKSERYQEIVYQSFEWLKSEMLDKTGGFYSALDADSEGIEGKYYVWDFNEIKKILKEDVYNPVLEYFQVTTTGNWENTNILHPISSIEDFCINNHLNESEFKSTLAQAKNLLLTARSKRIMPGLDNKIIAGWNGLMLSGLVDAYNAFGDEQFRDLAIANGLFIEKELLDGNRLLHLFKSSIPIRAFLDDYAAVIQGLLKLYQSTFDEKWIEIVDRLLTQCIESFYDNDSGFFYFSDKESATELITRKMELIDNVIPASNSIMANNFYLAGKIIDKEEYQQIAIKMLESINNLISKEPIYTTQWAILFGYIAYGIKEIVIVGDQVEIFRKQIATHGTPNIILTGTQTESKLPLLADKTLQKNTMIYVCENKSCKLPVNSVTEAIKQLQSRS